MLPGEINCAIVDSRGSTLQELVIESSRIDHLSLGDQIGAFQLVSCSRHYDCMKNLEYEIVIYNDGLVDVALTDVTVISLQGSKGLIEPTKELTIDAGGDFATSHQVSVNVCSNWAFQMAALVEGTTMNESAWCRDVNSSA